MNRTNMRLTHPPLLLLLPTALLCGCAHTQPAAKIAANGGLYNKFVPAEKTSIIGHTEVVDLQDATAIITLELSHAPFSEGSFLVARDAGNVPTAVLQATRQVSHTTPASQGVMIVSGQLSAGYEVVEPGPELARLVQENIDKYLVDHSAPLTPAPAAPANSTQAITPLPATDVSPPTPPTVPPPSA
ncbi:MAG TPA: hypothetical protein VHC95_05865 [Opitutales bacterium]|nr:hypothetical protein [Opitutales bacterium]